MEKIKIPKCPYCGTDSNVTCGLVRKGSIMVMNWHCTACGSFFASYADASSDRTLEVAAASLDYPVQAEYRNLPTFANEKMLRKTWIPDVYMKNLSAKTDVSREINEKHKSLADFIENKKEQTDKQCKRTYNLMLAGLILCILVVVLSVVSVVLMSVTEDWTELNYSSPWTSIHIRQLTTILTSVILPVLTAVEIAAAATGGRGLYLFNTKCKKIHQNAESEIAAETERVHGEIRAIEAVCEADVRRELDQMLVRNGFEPVTDEEIGTCVWKESEVKTPDSNAGEQIHKKRKIFNNKEYSSLYGVALSIGLVFILWVGILNLFDIVFK